MFKGVQRSLFSGRRDSNPQHTAWKAVTLPIEIHPHICYT